MERGLIDSAVDDGVSEPLPARLERCEPVPALDGRWSDGGGGLGMSCCSTPKALAVRIGAAALRADAVVVVLNSELELELTTDGLSGSALSSALS